MGWKGPTKTLVFAALQIWVTLAVVHAKSRRYKDDDVVPLIANKVGPFSNPSETYKFYHLPFCQPTKEFVQSHDLGEVLSGDHKVISPYDVKFKVNLPKTELCTRQYNEAEILKLQNAVDEEYYFEWFLDDLPIWGYIGDSPTAQDLILPQGPIELVTQAKYIYTHMHFTIKYNGDRIVEWNATAIPDFRADISSPEPQTVEFSYSVQWEESQIPFDRRMERYERNRFLPATFEIHWLSIINTFVLVVLLMVFLTIILMRVLKNDFTRYMNIDEEDEYVLDEEGGWKLLHGDVFRFPANKMLFTALLGAGTQLFAVILMLLILVLMSVFSPNKRGAIATALIFLYALTAGIGGYVSAYYYKQFGGENWVWNTILCACLFPAPLFVMFMFINTIAVTYGSTAALPFGTIMVVFALYALVSFPLTVVGGIAGRGNAPPFEAPCRTTKVPRQIPKRPWYRALAVQMFTAGFLPFSAIYIETHYIFASIWGHKIYSLFGILFLAFVLLLCVTSLITIALIYFQLAMEDHQWWWRSILYGGSTGLFLYGYCFFYFYMRSDMSGLLQTCFFFGYMLIVSYAFFMLLGTVGFFSSLFFVRHIYRAIKCE